VNWTPPRRRAKVTKLDPRDRRRLRALAADQPILGARCPAAQARLFEFSVEIRERTHVDEAGLEDAAREVFICVQEELALLDSPVDLVAALDLTNALWWERKALMYLHGAIGEKRIEMTLCDSSPLTVCVGSRTTART
jgi:hypothetical protein